MDNLKYMLEYGCYWKRKVTTGDEDGFINLEHELEKHDIEQEEMMEEIFSDIE